MDLGFLFIYIDFMSAAMETSRDYPEFITLMTKFLNTF